jgi:hypothetical protein
MSRIHALILVATILSPRVMASPVREESVDVRAYFPTQVYGESWVRALEGEWDRRQSVSPLPKGSVRLVLELMRPEWVQQDPDAAAADLHRLIREAEMLRLRGQPSWQVRVRIQHELSLPGRGVRGAGEALGRERASGAARGATRGTDNGRSDPGGPEGGGPPGNGQPTGRP